MNKIKIAIVDDQHLFREGLKSLLDDEKDLHLDFEATNGLELMQKLKETVYPPDVILLDIEMPIMDGIEATIKIRQKYPRIKIIILTMHDEQEMATHLIEKGAHSFMPKSSPFDNIVEAIHAVVKNGYYFNDMVSAAMVQKIMENKTIIPDFTEVTLTEKELEIVLLICREYTNAEIGEKLGYSTKTIDNTRLNIIKKIGVRNTAGIVMYAVRKGIVI